jgi:hypothetical protein
LCLQTDQRFPSVNSFDKGLVTNPDSSIDVWFGPKLPEGAAEANSKALLIVASSLFYIAEGVRSVPAATLKITD